LLFLEIGATGKRVEKMLLRKLESVRYSNCLKLKIIKKIILSIFSERKKDLQKQNEFLQVKVQDLC
jgi:hypothetical protein